MEGGDLRAALVLHHLNRFLFFYIWHVMGRVEEKPHSNSTTMAIIDLIKITLLHRIPFLPLHSG